MRNTRFKAYLPDICAIALLLLLGLVPFSMLFTSQPFIYGDNSFHYAELYETLTQSNWLSGLSVHWNPDWFAGIPEFQFYPVGFVMLGIGINLVTGQLLPIGLLYNLLLLLALLIPVIAGYLLVRKLGFDTIAAFFSGLLLLMLPNFGLVGGFYYGVFIGLFNARIGLGLGLIVLWYGIKFIDRPDRYRYAIGIAVTLALTILFHPDYLLIPVSFLLALFAVSIFLKQQPTKSQLLSIIYPILIGVGLTGFWLVPMLANHGYTASMQVWSHKIGFTPDGAGFWNLCRTLWTRDTDKFILFLDSSSILFFWNPQRDRTRRIYLGALLLTPLLILLGILTIKFLAIERLQIAAIDPARLIDGIAVYLILIAGIGLYQLVEFAYRYLMTWNQNLKSKLIGSITLLLLVAALYYTSYRLVKVYFDFPKLFHSKAFLSYVIKSYQLDEVWKYLSKSEIRNPKSEIETGRILITAVGLPIKGMPSNFKSQALCLTPIYTQRQIIGGLNTPFYPIASYLYFGKKPPLIIQMEADKIDNRSLLGVPWEQMEESKLVEFCQKLNITEIVVNQHEDKVAGFFDRSSSFRLDKRIDAFKIYTIPLPAFAGMTSSLRKQGWLDYDTTSANIRITKFDKDRITLSVTAAAEPTPILIKVAYYPCWKATLTKSQIPNPKSQIKITTDEIGLMQLVLPPGDNYQVQLSYQRTWVETFGDIITIISILILLSCSFISIRQKK